MKKCYYSIVVFVTLFSLWGSIAIAQNCPEQSAWKNQRGSTMHIDIDSTGMITGYYINNEQGTFCQGTPYPVIGWILDGTNTITFSVRWSNASENCSSITSWTGFFNEDCSKLTTRWQLVVDGTTDPSQIKKGEDVFTLITQKKSGFIKNK